MRAGEPVAILGAGEYFGHARRGRQAEDPARARSEVRAGTVRSDQAHRLLGALSGLGKAVRTEA